MSRASTTSVESGRSRIASAARMSPSGSCSSAIARARSTTAGSVSSGKSFGRISSQSASGPPSRIRSIVAARPSRRSGVSGSAREPTRTSACTRSGASLRHRERAVAAHRRADQGEVALEIRGRIARAHSSIDEPRPVEVGREHLVAGERLELRLPHPRVEREGVQEDDLHAGSMTRSPLSR